MKTVYKVAIQGTFGAFHEVAAKRYFKNKVIEIVPCETFQELIQTVESGNVDYGMMAIENTVAGSILPNYALIQNSKLEIVGEYYMRIVQNLLAPKGSSFGKLKKVCSHPMAIYQSSIFFKNYPHIKLIDSVDTAISARDVAKEGDPTNGVIASKNAAELYGLNILAEGIEDNKKNYTRFFALRQKSETKKIHLKVNKASLCFSLPHATGSLSAILSIFAFYDINLNKIQSHPIIGEPGRYAFHVDLVFENHLRYSQCLQAIKPLIQNITILGEYEEGYQSYKTIHSSSTEVK